MKISKYIENIIEKRAKAADPLNSLDYKLAA